MKLFIFLLITLFFTQCSTNSTETVSYWGSIVYGNVNGIDESNFENIAIGLSVHRDECEIPPANFEAITPVTESGYYSFLYRSLLSSKGGTCHQATLLYIEEGKEDSVLTAPIELKVDWRSESPYDSVRVDFTLED